ncbi:hypothetical protein AC579_918 [Pseudocercospora musae]|uniref:Uncharacterized protein n=1 Tax=Pseudocercospora musae TaxID=113226 RepID=A0A139HCB0_9PEZI|nr:hypothetical protein AC579_918 [Pseudocercospora musae]
MGHHLFYSSLQGRDIAQTTFDQARNINIGTAFAFLVKICLSVAIAAAYGQLLWRTFLSRSLRVAQIDSLSSMIASPGLDAIGHAFTFPALMAVATIGWFISVATIFPPGTLSVHGDVGSNKTSMTVPTLDFSQPIISREDGRGISASGINVQPGDPSYYTFPAPPRAIASVLSTMTAFTGIPRTSGAQSNTSYGVTFHGPALQCSTSQVNTTPVFCDGDQDLPRNSVYYTSFLKYPQESGSSFRTFWDLNASVPSGGNDSISCNDITSYRTTVFGNTPPVLYVVLLGTETANITGWNVTTCQLQNATYSVNTSFPDGQQVISAKVDDFTPLKDTIDYFQGYHGNISDITDLTAGTNGIYNYLAMMSLMSQITVGTVNSGSGAQQMSYEEGASLDVTSAETPSIFSTSLTTSPEMKALHETVFTLSDISNVEDSAFDGPTSAPLAQQLEELFRNLTVAMSTNPSTSSYQSVTGLIDFSINRYEYQAEHLWISYGIGILLTALIVVLGYFAVASNGAPYSIRYSTFLRTTPWQTAEKSLAGEGRLGDRGSDPVPSHIAHLQIQLGNYAISSGVESEILLGDAQKAGGTPMIIYEALAIPYKDETSSTTPEFLESALFTRNLLAQSSKKRSKIQICSSSGGSAVGADRQQHVRHRPRCRARRRPRARERRGDIEHLRAQLPATLSDTMKESTADNMTIQGNHMPLDQAKDCAIVLIALSGNLQLLRFSSWGLPFTRSAETPDYEVEQNIGIVEGINAMSEEKARMRALELVKKVVTIPDQAIREDQKALASMTVLDSCPSKCSRCKESSMLIAHHIIYRTKLEKESDQVFSWNLFSTKTCE